MDRILMRGLKFYGYHGVLEEEKRSGQNFVVDIDAQVADFSRAAQNDILEYTVDYSQLYSKIKDIVEGDSVDLLETLAEKIATSLLEVEEILEVRVLIKKPQAPIPGEFDYMGIEIVRGR